MTLIQPNPEMQLRIRSELNEDVNTRQRDLETIKDWLALQPHLPHIDDDQRIMTFLRGCKFSIEKTKRKLDMYFTMRTAAPELFSDRDVTRPELREILDAVCFPPLPGLTKKGYRVVVMKGHMKDWGAVPKVTDAMKLVLMIGDIRLYEEQTGVAGDVYVFDASIATPSHFARFTPSIVKKFLTIVQEAYPVKLKEVHVINVSPLVDTIINFAKPFLKEKIRGRIHVHSTLETLYDFVPQDILPVEYGGNAGPIGDIHDSWVKKMESYKGWFKDQEKLKANEARRPGKPKTVDEIFGMEGSFKKLVID